ncbi:Phosphatidylinositol 4-kinase pik1alpha (PI4-kinase)(PtdIns-4-kinase), partial [Coemansia sp. 'formosensis']
AEIKFMTTLMDISQRVCAVSRLGRQQFLKAELTLLNHNLDKSTCIPLWCPDSNGLCHHRIVRIPTEDTVVLNSAERAPYLLTLEVLEPERSDHAESVWSASVVGEGSGLATLATDSTVPDVGGIRSDPIALYVDPSELCEGSPSKEKSVDAFPVTPVAPRPPSLVLPKTPRTLMSPGTGEDVDEQLMAEVFGDIDNISDIPDTPLSPSARHRQFGSYDVNGQRIPAKDNPRAISSSVASATKQESLDLGREASPADTRYTLNQPQRENNPALLAVPPFEARTTTSRAFISQEEIRARMRTASVLLAQLARQQKALGIKVANLVVPQPANIPDGDGTKVKSDMSETMKRRSKLGNATSQALAMEEIREKLVREMMQLEELRLKQPGLDSMPGSAVVDDGTSQAAEDDIGFHEVEFKDDPSAKVLKEDWESKKARIRRTSPYGRRKNWNLLSVIVKEGADLRQEQLALQLIREMQRIWQREHINVFVQYYRIMVTGEGCGLMETITNTVSVHSIKKEFYSRNAGYVGPPYTLYNYFVSSYGTPDTQRFRDAQDNFMRSLVPYSLITYVLQIRDRHNGNILLDTAGHIIHIDFGFMLYNSPGSVGFEQAPFKFPMEYVDILGGRGSAKFEEFRQLLTKAFLGMRKHADNVCLLVEMMLKDSPLPCLGGGAATVTALRDRFHLTLSEQQAEELASTLDAEVFNALTGAPDAKVFPHLSRWYTHIASKGDAIASLRTADAPVAAAEAEAAAEEEDDEDVDLFGSDDEEDEEAEKLKAQRLAEYQAKKAAKPAVIAKSMLGLEVKPWEAETDLDELERLIRTIEMDGLIWNQESKRLPIAYGVNKIVMAAVVEDAKVSVDEIVEMIEAFEDYTQSVDIIAFNKL